MMLAPLILDGPARGVIPAFPIPTSSRDARPLYVLQRTVYRRSSQGWDRIPRGYVTDFASIPGLATLITLLGLRPLGPWAWAALGHDWRFAIGQPGRQPLADAMFRELMKVDGVDPIRREIMYRTVRLAGAGGYARAPGWWDTLNFADPETGAPVAAPFGRHEAFAGGPWGLREAPDWRET